MPLSHHPPHAHTFRHAQAHTIASASHARASDMHTPARQPDTPCGPSATVCPAACERLCVIPIPCIPPHGVTPPPGVKISGRSKLPMRPQSKTKFATEAPSLCYKNTSTVHPQRLHSTHTNTVARNTQPTGRKHATRRPRWTRRAHTARTCTRRTKRRPGNPVSRL